MSDKTLRDAVHAVDQRLRSLAGHDLTAGDGLLGEEGAFAPVFVGICVPFPDAASYCRHTTVQTIEHCLADSVPIDVLMYGMLMRTLLTGMMAVEIHNKTGD